MLLTKLSNTARFAIPSLENVLSQGLKVAAYSQSASDNGNRTSRFTIDKHYERVRNQNFGPILLKDSHHPKGNLAKPTFDYVERDHLVYDGIPYNKLPLVYISARWNNTIVTVMQQINPPKQFCNVSCNKIGIHNAKKKTTHAAEMVAQTAGRKAQERGCTTHVRVVLKGIGIGRRPAINGLVQSGLKVVSISDKTPITNDSLPQRPRKIRRL